MQAINNLLPVSYQFGLELFKAYKKRLEFLGYVNGLTYQSAPYDWRIGYRETALNENFWPMVEDLWAISDKKVSMLGFSWGNKVLLNQMYAQETAVKDRLVERVYMVGPPTLGGLLPLSIMLGFNNVMDLSKYNMGLDLFMGKEIFPRLKVFYELLPVDVSGTFKDAEWFQEMRTRMQADQEKRVYRSVNKAVGLFPPFDRECMVPYKYKNETRCTIGVSAFDNYGYVMGRKITKQSMRQIFEAFSAAPEIPSVYESTIDRNIEELRNPGVQTFIVYSSIVPTESKYYYLKNPRKVLAQGKEANPDYREYAFGDGTMTTSSAIIPGIKWADDYNKGTVEGAKPVGFVEFCSQVNQKDRPTEEGEEFTENEHMGLQCSCQKDLNRCAHGNLINDPKLINFVFNGITSHKAGVAARGRFAHFSEYDWFHYVNGCSLYLRE